MQVKAGRTDSFIADVHTNSAEGYFSIFKRGMPPLLSKVQRASVSPVVLGLAAQEVPSTVAGLLLPYRRVRL